MRCLYCRQLIGNNKQVCDWCGRRQDDPIFIESPFPREDTPQGEDIPRLGDEKTGKAESNDNEGTTPEETPPSMIPQLSDLEKRLEEQETAEEESPEEPKRKDEQAGPPAMPPQMKHLNDTPTPDEPPPDRDKSWEAPHETNIPVLPEDGSVVGKEEDFPGAMDFSGERKETEQPHMSVLPEDGTPIREEPPIPVSALPPQEPEAETAPQSMTEQISRDVDATRAFFRWAEIRKALKTDPWMTAVVVIVALRALAAVFRLAGLNIPGVGCFCDLLAIASLFGLIAWQWWAWYVLMFDNIVATAIFIFGTVRLVVFGSEPGMIAALLLQAPSAFVFFVLLARRDYFD